MNLNPITTLMDLLSKLVVEHGSAVITDKHIALLRDQSIALEKEKAAMATDNENLRAKVKYLTAENEQLKKRIQQYEEDNNNPPDSWSDIEVV